MSFFAELKRRNVVRVGIAYVIGGWLLLQLTEVLSELLTLPGEIGPIVVAIVAIGFPIVLFAAWAFELTPEGVKRESEVDRDRSITPSTGKKLNTATIVMLALAVLYLLYDKFSGSRPEAASTPAMAVTEMTGTSEAALALKAGPEISRQSIAVLPFDNRSRLEEDEFFVEGIHDDLLTNLARIGSLKVISRTSVNLYKDSDKPIPEIARELGVATIMEGAVQRAGNTVRINVQLIDAETDEHLWAEIYDRELTTENLFTIQTEISERIASALEATLSPEEQERISEFPTQSLDAYNAYLKGRQLIAKRNSADLEAALQEFERAVELDPEFALAWVGIAETNLLLPEYGTALNEPSMQSAEVAAKRALEINPGLGEAYASLAQVAEENNRFDDAEQAYRTALDLNPGYATSYHWYANFVRNTGGPQRFREIFNILQQGLELDPHSAVIRQNLVVIHRLTGKFDLAEQIARSAIELHPEFPGLNGSLSVLYFEELGRLDEGVYWARKAVEHDPGNMGLKFGFFMELLALGTDTLANDILQRMEDLDADHGRVSQARAFIALRDGRLTAVAEELQYLESLEGWNLTLAFMYAHIGQWDKARLHLLREEPGVLDRQQWPAQLARMNSDVCLVGKVLIETGDAQLGLDLVEFALDYATNELPLYIDHSDRYPFAFCHLLQGKVDAAIAGLQTAIDHGHEINNWWAWSTFPLGELLRRDPRYPALAQQVEEVLIPQRARVEQMFEEWEGESL